MRYFHIWSVVSFVLVLSLSPLPKTAANKLPSLAAQACGDASFNSSLRDQLLGTWYWYDATTQTTSSISAYIFNPDTTLDMWQSATIGSKNACYVFLDETHVKIVVIYNLPMSQEPQQYMATLLGNNLLTITTSDGATQYYKKTVVNDIQTDPNCPSLPARLEIGKQGQSIRDGSGPSPVRAEAGKGNINFYIEEGGVFTVIGGPICSISTSVKNNGTHYRYFQIRNSNGQVGWIAEGDDKSYFIEPILQSTDSTNGTPNEPANQAVANSAAISITQIGSKVMNDGVVYPPRQFKFSPDSSKLLVYAQGQIQILGVPSLDLVKSFQVSDSRNSGPIFDVSNDGKFVYVPNPDDYANHRKGTLRVWDISSNTLVNELTPCTAFVYCQAWALNPTSSRGAVVVALEDRSEIRDKASTEGGGYSTSKAAQYPDPLGIVIFDLNTGTQLNIFNISDLITNAFQEVRKLRFSQDGSILAAEIAGGAGTVVWDSISGQQLITIESASSFALSSDGQMLATNGLFYANNKYTSTIRLASIRSGQITSISDFESATTMGIAFIPNSYVLISTYSDGFIRLWDLDSKAEVAEVAIEASGNYGVTVSFDGFVFAVASQDGNIGLFRIDSNVIRTLDIGGYQLDLIFDPKGCLLLNGHDLIVRELQRELDTLNSKTNNVSVYVEIFKYLSPLIGGVEVLRRQVEGMMLDINPNCVLQDFAYRIGDDKRGIRFVDSSGLGNIAYGYFATLFTAPQWTQSIVADMDQKINPGSWVEAFRQCSYELDCTVRSITVVGDNDDDRRQRLVGEQMAKSEMPLTIDLFIRYSNTYQLY